VYVYAVLGGVPPCETGVGVCAERLRVIELGGVVALVGDVAGAPEPTAITLRVQDGVLRRLSALVVAVLPVRFGTVMSDDGALREVLAARAPQLARALGRVSGCEQMTLRVWGEVEAVALGRPVGRESQARVVTGRPRAGEGAHGVPELGPARHRVQDLVREERTERQDRPPLLATVQQLIPRGASGRYIGAIDTARDGLWPWRVSVTGPWPAYAFVEEGGVSVQGTPIGERARPRA
jgi:hypothetical protein